MANAIGMWFACLIGGVMVYSAPLQAEIITFDDITTNPSAIIPDGYHGYNWQSHDDLFGTVGGPVSVIADGAPGNYSVSSIGFQIQRTDSSFFDALSLSAASSFVPGNLFVASGFAGATLKYQTSLVIGPTAMTPIQLDFHDIDTLWIYSGSIDAFKVDNLNVASVPLPAAALPMLSGLITLMIAGRRRRK